MTSLVSCVGTRVRTKDACANTFTVSPQTLYKYNKETCEKSAGRNNNNKTFSKKYFFVLEQNSPRECEKPLLVYIVYRVVIAESTLALVRVHARRAELC